MKKILTARSVGARSVERSDGSVEISSMSGGGTSNNDLGYRTEELIDTDDTVDTEDGVLVREVTDRSEETCVGDGPLGRGETVEGVGVTDDDREEMSGTDGVTELSSVIGVNKEDSSDVMTEALGLRKDVSKEVSSPSGSAID